VGDRPRNLVWGEPSGFCLYIGGKRSAESKEFLDDRRITRVVNCGIAHGVENVFEGAVCNPSLGSPWWPDRGGVTDDSGEPFFQYTQLNSNNEDAEAPHCGDQWVLITDFLKRCGAQALRQGTLSVQSRPVNQG
jgi:hypothetical protein